MKRLSYVGTGVGARVFAVVAVALLYALCNANAQAGLILGTNQLGSKQTIAPEGAVEINLSGFNGRFFGKAVPSIWLAENGYLSKKDVSGEDYFSESLATNTHSRIANFWDDISLYPGVPGVGSHHGIFLSHKQGQYLAATWSQVFLYNDLVEGEPLSSQRSGSFQTIWFEADTNLANFQFKKDDIAMGFSGLSAASIEASIEASIDATVGLKDDTQFFTIDDVVGRERGLAPGGLISTNPNDSNSHLNNAHLLPWDSDKILLFRPEVDSEGSFTRYQVTIETITAIPEPNSCVLFGAATCLFLWFKAKQKRQRRKYASKSQAI